MRVTGRWIGRRRVSDGRALLIVEADGRRHRFPAVPERRRARVAGAERWAASFALPAWLEQRLDGQISLWIGNLGIPLPPVAFVDAEVDRQPSSADDLPSPARLAQMVAALRSELEACTADQARVEAAQSELRRELGQLAELIEQQHPQRAEIESTAVAMAAQVAELQAQMDELRAELAVSSVSREAAESEAAGLRVERDRLGAELASARGEVGIRGTDLGGAEALLAEARALTSSMLQRRGLAVTETADA